MSSTGCGKILFMGFLKHTLKFRSLSKTVLTRDRLKKVQNMPGNENWKANFINKKLKQFFWNLCSDKGFFIKRFKTCLVPKIGKQILLTKKFKQFFWKLLYALTMHFNPPKVFLLPSSVFFTLKDDCKGIRIFLAQTNFSHLKLKLLDFLFLVYI